MAECDVEDILCQIEVLRSMRALRSALGSFEFKTEFPELEGMEPKLLGRIETAKGDMQKALAKCGNIELGSPEMETVVEEVTEIPEGEEEESEEA